MLYWLGLEFYREQLTLYLTEILCLAVIWEVQQLLQNVCLYLGDHLQFVYLHV